MTPLYLIYIYREREREKGRNKVIQTEEIKSMP